MTIADFCERFRISRTTAYRQINAGLIFVVKVGHATRIRKADAEHWAAQNGMFAKNENVPYKGHTMDIIQTDTFQKWFEGLRDRPAQKHILVRIGRLERGLFGDIKPVGEGVSELRIHQGAGYRLYLTRRGDAIVLLLCGGDKDSQERDIVRAKQLAQDLAKDTET